MIFLAGPLVAIVGIVAVFFVLRRKSVEKRSMYSARRSQIEHKVRAARQRTLAPHGHVEKAGEPAAAPGASPFDQGQVQPTITYQAPAYEAPPVAPPPRPPRSEPAPSEPMPWETPSAPAPAPSGWDFPPATAAPEPPYTPPPAAPPEPFRPAPEPTPMPPSEQVWTPAPKPAEPLTPAHTAAPAASGTAAGSWEIVNATKDSGAISEAPSKSRGKGGTMTGTSSWQLASGDAPGSEAEELEAKRPSGTLVAVAQYAVLVVGLVMVLIGVLVMVANSHVTP